MPINLTTYPDYDLAVFTCVGFFDHREWLTVSKGYLSSQATYQINDIRQIDFEWVTPEVLQSVAMATKRLAIPGAPGRGKTAFIITKEFNNFNLFNDFMRWVHTLALNRDFALFYSTAEAIEWFGIDSGGVQVPVPGHPASDTHL